MKPFLQPFSSLGRMMTFSSRLHSAMSRPFFTHVNTPFIPAHLTGGGNNHKLLGPDTEMVDVFSVEEITSACLLFNPDEWIGKGKTWSATLPPHVQLAFADVQSIPAWILNFIPQAHVSVSDLQAIALPSSSTHETHAHLSTEYMRSGHQSNLKNAIRFPEPGF